MEKNQQGTTGSTKFWMTVEQAENPQEFAKNIPGEFSASPIREGHEKDGLDRRDFMKIMGASAMMASLAGCTRRPVQHIVPYVTNPEEIIPGQPNFYASSDPQTGYGLVVKTREGRPIKVDGNMDHPLNKGSISARGQASVHDLYDPDRLRAPKIDGAEVSWADFDVAVKKALASSKGATWLLTGTVHSPTLSSVVQSLGMQHVMVDSMAMDDVLDSQQQSYGSRVFPRYRFDQADYVVSLDADFLNDWGSAVEYTGQFSGKRRLDGNKISMAKLVSFESVMTITGQASDERFTVHPSDSPYVALGLAHEVARLSGRSAEALSAFTPAAVAQRTGVAAEKIQEVARDLVKYRGRSLVVASGKNPATALSLQNIVNFLNSTLENEGETVDGTAAPSNQFQGSYKDAAKLLSAIRTGSVKTLIIQGVNPAYLFGEATGWREALKKVPNLIYFGSYLDETASLAKYVAAESHAFESWGDVNPQRGVYGIVQPTIRPLWQTKSLLDALVDWSDAVSGTKVAANGYEAVRATWKGLHSRNGVGAGFADWWDDVLMTGTYLSSSGSREGRASSRSYKMDVLGQSVDVVKKAATKNEELALVLTHSVAMGDGSQSNNALLQELPDPVSKNTWGTYLAVAPSTAKKLGWKNGEFVKLENAAGSVEIAVYEQPGLHPGVVASYLGYGRKFNGRLGNDVGVSFANFTVNGASVQPNCVVTGLKISKTGKSEKIPCTQGHHSLEGRDIVFDTSLEQYRKNAKSGIVRHFPDPPSIWSKHEYPGYKWGMVIDLTSCTGCSACVVACSVENNVPSVGKDQVQKGREMQWLRIDRYYSGDPETPETIQQPMLCQHCDNAPCETVCPVLATVHSDDGLNQMVYNRCVGTKYCSNNCPYKVRRFNWFENNAPMNAPMEHPLPLSKNPEVTLRSRGVMEKCTFCVQRIEAGKSKARSEGRRAGDNDIRTACQDACAADAIVFGDLNNPESAVAKKAKSARGFTSLEELNTRAAITYLTKVRNRPEPAAHANEHGGAGEHH